MDISAGILTVSDRCSKGILPDESGPALRKMLETRHWAVSDYEIIADEEPLIRGRLISWCDQKNLDLIKKQSLGSL